MKHLINSCFFKILNLQICNFLHIYTMWLVSSIAHSDN